uniref:Uncharacterized protein n=1 Tax=Aegilops tauschii subsp. strangulata TaxID=200361 RepID=A0A453SXJ3_AEGTS
MRMEFDQQQQDLVDAASKALSYRQDIMEENLRLTHSLQAARRRRSTFVSSLLPLLSAHNLQPSVPDAQSIVGNLKVLFTHSQEKLAITEVSHIELRRNRRNHSTRLLGVLNLQIIRHNHLLILLEIRWLLLAKPALALCPSKHILMQSLQFLIPFELDGIGIYWQMRTVRSSQPRLL